MVCCWGATAAYGTSVYCRASANITLIDTCNDRREDIQIKWATVCRMEIIKGTFTCAGHTSEALESSTFTSKRLEKQQLA